MLHKHTYISFKSYIIVFGCVLFSFQLFGQNEKVLSLNETLKLARKNSLDAFRSKSQYAIGYWNYRSFKASLLPKVDFDLEPFTFNRSFVQRYDPENNIDVFRQQRNLNTYSQLSLTQNVLPTGATVFVNSSFNRLENFNDDGTIKNYTTTPIRIGLIQPIMAYNALKWRKKTASLEYEKAKKEFISAQQEINLRGISLFFNWALANTKVDIALENKKNTERLYSINKKRYDLGSIEKDDLLNLELEQLSAKTTLTKIEQELQIAISDLRLFLNKEDIDTFKPELPELISNLKIEIVKAEEQAEKNNPDILNINIRRINALRDLNKTIKENRFDLSINVSFGLNQQADEFVDAYQNLLDQQLLSVRFSVPILDWGERKGNIKVARLNKEVTEISIEQDHNEIKRQILEKVNNFNLQEEQVLISLKKKNISKESYTITEKRFFSGKVDLLRLLNAQRAWQKASEEYIQSLQDYWVYYYEVQRLTLYDFIDKITLSENFDKLLD